jgi:protein SCO1/2
MDARLSSSFAIAAALLLAGCGNQGETETVNDQGSSNPAAATKQPAASPIRTFEVAGVVKELYPEKLSAKIKHEEIPDYMPAMTMNLSVKDVAELEGLAPEDEIAFRLNVTDEEHWIDQVRKRGSASTEVGTPLTQPSNWRLVREVEPLDIGDPMPNYDFTNELGQAVSLADLKGTAYAFTFIFTRCPLPDFCPRMSSHFQEAQKILKERPDAPKNWRLFSITMDPEFDTPLVLKTYASRYQYDADRWSHLTAPLIDITAIGEQFGLEFYKPDGTIAHNLRTVVVDAAGRIQNIIIGNSWKAEDLADYLVAAAAVKPDALAETAVND